MARRPSALKHGLTSRFARDTWPEDVSALAEALLDASPREPSVVEAARATAEAILYLRRVQQCRLLALDHGTLARAARTDAEKSAANKLLEAIKGEDSTECRRLRVQLDIAHDCEWKVGVEPIGFVVLGLELSDRARELRRLSEYERRAASARRRALRVLDYEMIEAERRRTAEARRAPPRRAL